MNLSHHFLSMDGWPGDATFSRWGQPLKNSAKKRSSPLDLIFDTCASASWSHFFVGEAEHMCLHPFAGTNEFSAKKKMFCNLGARWHKILEFVLSYPIYGGLAWWCDFFPVGPTFEDHPQVFSQKMVQPLGFYFWHLRLGLFKPLFWLVKLNICVRTLLQGKCVFSFTNWASRSVEFSGLNGIVRVCYYFWPLNLHFTFWERPFVTSNMHLEINILCLTYANSAL